MKLYLAGPLFSRAERNFNEQLEALLEVAGFETWLPQDIEPRESTPKAIFEMDLEGIDWCDTVVACMDGPDADSGTAWECGYAFARGKHILLYRTDFRKAGDSGEPSLNLMLLGCADRYIHAPYGTVEALAELIVERLQAWQQNIV